MTQEKEISSGSIEKVSSSLLNPDFLKSPKGNWFGSYYALQKEHGVALQKITSLEEENTRLKEQLQLMQHRLFGKKSESSIGEPISASTSEPLSLSGSCRHFRGSLFDFCCCAQKEKTRTHLGYQRIASNNSDP